MRKACIIAKNQAIDNPFKQQIWLAQNAKNVRNYKASTAMRGKLADENITESLSESYTAIRKAIHTHVDDIVQDCNTRGSILTLANRGNHCPIDESDTKKRRGKKPKSKSKSLSAKSKSKTKVKKINHNGSDTSEEESQTNAIEQNIIAKNWYKDFVATNPYCLHQVSGLTGKQLQF